MRSRDGWHRHAIDRCRGYLLRKRCAYLAARLYLALEARRDEVPVLVVSYNNGTYVRNCVRQLAALGIVPIVIDNRSDDPGTLAALDELRGVGLAQIVRAERNHGHLVGFLDPVYAVLPGVFAYTDPDLGFSAQMPANFLSVLAGLTSRYSVYKAGLALSLLRETPMSGATLDVVKRRPMRYVQRMSIMEWEMQFWRKRVAHESLLIYSAPVDTTFAVYRKSNYRGDFYDAVRVAGPYAAIHLPWYPALDPMSGAERAKYLSNNGSTTWVGA